MTPAELVKTLSPDLAEVVPGIYAEVEHAPYAHVYWYPEISTSLMLKMCDPAFDAACRMAESRYLDVMRANTECAP